MTNVRPLIDQYDKRLELTAEPERLRWQQFHDARRSIEHIGDTMYAFVHDRNTWASVHAHCSQQGQTVLTEICIRLKSLVDKLLKETGNIHLSAQECDLKQAELRQNVAVVTFKAIESHHAFRPPEVACAIKPGVKRVDLFAPPTTRIDFFNPGLGHPLPPSGQTHINDGLADPNAEDAAGVVRPHPLVRADLVKDPTNSIPISNM